MRTLGIVLVGWAWTQAVAGALSIVPPERPIARGQLVELRIDGLPELRNPFDPSEAAIDAEVVAPSGKTRVAPAFFITPHRGTEQKEEPRIVKHMRLFFGTTHYRKGERLELLLDDLVLVDNDTGERVVLDDFEGELAWENQRADEAAIDRTRAHGGTQCLRVALTVPEKPGWPGAGRKLGNVDWSRFDELRLWACPLSGLRVQGPGIEFYTKDDRKFQATIQAVQGAKEGKWVEFVWRLRSLPPPLKWDPSGPSRWLVRLRPQEAGEHRVRARVRDANGVRTSEWRTFRVTQADSDGYLRVSAKSNRYLAFDSGKPYFANGINLLGRDLGSYGHYIGKLAAHGGNFIRIWLSPRTMGFLAKETGPTRYLQDRAARLDALFDLCAEKGVYVMVCITDFRECDTRPTPGSYWKDSPWNAAHGGAAKAPQDFFTDPKAKELYRRLLRYLVARYGHSPHVLAWEFFNEVNITDGWRTKPDSVRAWHREMAEYLRGIDPQQHIITSSYAGIEDDALWEQPLMEIAQRHEYFDGERSFTDAVAEAHAKLWRHPKPVLMGEFGRRKNRYGEQDRRGLSLHNGLWAAMMSGGCGTAMSWWWQWIDDHKLWTRFRAIDAFAQGINWPAEGFRPSSKAAVTAKADPKHGFGPLAFRPSPQGGFKPGPAHQPVELRIGRDGTLDDPRKLPGFLHGVRNHRELHNPVTFQLDLPAPGGLTAVIEGVSPYGGAALACEIDGKPVRREEFPGAPGVKKALTKHNGPWRVPVPAGKHAVTLTNTGSDWIRVSRYELDAARPTVPVRVLLLRGRRTTLAWVWNESHAWYQPVYGTAKLTLGDVRATLDGFEPGRYRVRPFDPWAGTWGADATVAVGEDGKLTLAAGTLASDVAFRIERR